ncbi:hypothetical protein EB796_000700 [Bugula neritina]|uniref:Uncharacterized protein n=1 Tax=Bugula neritina TaxID=10212 RepID=A0A7J7KSB0_BUGNE|nr:hypothetical protein EB796_000700 [Bugula neritina]
MCVGRPGRYQFQAQPCPSGKPAVLDSPDKIVSMLLDYHFYAKHEHKLNKHVDVFSYLADQGPYFIGATLDIITVKLEDGRNLRYKAAQWVSVSVYILLYKVLVKLYPEC